MLFYLALTSSTPCVRGDKPAVAGACLQSRVPPARGEKSHVKRFFAALASRLRVLLAVAVLSRERPLSACARPSGRSWRQKTSSRVSSPSRHGASAACSSRHGGVPQASLALSCALFLNGFFAFYPLAFFLDGFCAVYPLALVSLMFVRRRSSRAVFLRF